MAFSRHLYAILGLAAVLTAVSFGTGATKKVASPLQTVVTNTTANPVPVRSQGITAVQEVAPAARTYVSERVDAAIEPDDFQGQATVYTVPAGKRLVVQQIFGQAVMGQDERITFAVFGRYPVTFIPTGNGLQPQGQSIQTKAVSSFEAPANFVVGP